MDNLVNKTVNLSLVGHDSNAFYLLGVFITQAERENWTEEEIRIVTDEAESGEYNHLLAVLDTHCSLKDGE